MERLMFHMEDLVANALIELLENGIRKVNIKQLRGYKEVVYKLFEEIGYVATFPMQDSELDRMLSIYGDFFYMVEDEKHRWICLKEDKGEIDLRKVFRSYLPLNYIQLFYNPLAVSKLLEEDK